MHDEDEELEAGFKSEDEDDPLDMESLGDDDFGLDDEDPDRDS